MKVVHVVVAGEVGGAERMLVDLASYPGLSGADHVVALMTPSQRLAQLFRTAGLDVRDRGTRRENPVAFLWRALGPSDVAWLEGVLRAERADIVQLHTFGSQVVGTRAGLLAGVPVLRTEHSSRVYKDASCWPFSRWSLARAARVVAVSEHIRRVVLDRDAGIEGRLVVVPNGVDTARFAPRPPAPRTRTSAFSFVMVGRLEPRKGVDVAIEALSRVPGARLDVVGDGPERESLERRAVGLGLQERVSFHGYLEDPRDVLANAHVALCSSREEGLGIALLEAMAMERPVVALPVGGVPELVLDGRTGWLARDCTKDALAARMVDAMSEDAGRIILGKAARAAVVGGYSLRAMCEGYGVVYASLARRPSRAAGASVEARDVGGLP